MGKIEFWGWHQQLWLKKKKIYDDDDDSGGSEDC